MNRYKTFAPRFIALLLDVIILLPLSIATDMFANTEDGGMAGTVILAAANFINILYFFLLHWLFGQTAGKYLMKVKVVDVEKEGPIGFRRAFVRELPQIIGVILTFIPALSLPIGGHPEAPLTLVAIPIIIWALADVIVFLTNERRRALHDMIAGTIVVKIGAPQPES